MLFENTNASLCEALQFLKQNGVNACRHSKAVSWEGKTFEFRIIKAKALHRSNSMILPDHYIIAQHGLFVAVEKYLFESLFLNLTGDGCGY